MRLRVISLSVLLHIFVLLIFSLSASWMWTKKREQPTAPPVFIEIKTIADRTQTDRRAAEKKAESRNTNEQAVKEPPKPEIKPPAPDKKPPKAATSKRQTAELTAPPKPPDPKPVKKQEEAKPPPQPVIKPREAPPQKKPEPEKPVKKAAPKPEQDFGSVLKNLAENQEKTEQQPVIKAPEAPKNRQDFLKSLNLEEDNAGGHNLPLGDSLTVSEVDMLRRQLERCWDIPIGARDAQNLVIKVHLVVNPDRTVRRAEIVEKARYHSDSFFRAAADSALRAVHSPDCTPLNLPERKYASWKEIVVTFDPRYMF